MQGLRLTVWGLECGLTRIETVSIWQLVGRIDVEQTRHISDRQDQFLDLSKESP